MYPPPPDTSGPVSHEERPIKLLTLALSSHTSSSFLFIASLFRFAHAFSHHRGLN